MSEKSGEYLCDHSHIQIINLDTNLAKNFKKYSKTFIFSRQKSTKEKKREWNIFMSLKKNFAGVQLTTNIDPTLFLSRLYLKSSIFSFLGPLYRFGKYIINFTIFIINILYKILYRILDKIGKPGRYSFEFFFSKQKNSFNNLNLNKKKDKFGLNKIDINWSINKSELKNYNEMINKFLNGSRLLIDKKINLKNFENKVYVGLHPSCSNSFGVGKKFFIDKNLKIKKTSNLYVCGSDVFPSNGFTNPTWTIMTLGTRLSQHLKKKFTI